MQLIRGLHNLRTAHRGCVLTIGNFDGVHRGHQAILKHLLRCARARHLPAAVLSFEPLPREYFSGERAPARLTNLREKCAALDCYGAERFVCLRFDERMRNLATAEFIDEILVSRLGVQHVLVGHDFRFARDRSGTIEDLRQAGAHHGFTVEELAPFCVDGVRVSSTRVRAALETGEMNEAAALLGRPFRMSGRVIGGQQLGRRLGYPTANLSPGRLRVPISGVFAARVTTRSLRRYPAVVNVGTRPVVNGQHVLIEAHLLDFSGDLYGAHMKVDFIARLRGEEWFPSLDALVEQMRRDEAEARELLHVSAP
jgi:riboflavin kinase/FMN adenylyltransferase